MEVELWVCLVAKQAAPILSNTLFLYYRTLGTHA